MWGGRDAIQCVYNSNRSGCCTGKDTGGRGWGNTGDQAGVRARAGVAERDTDGLGTDLRGQLLARAEGLTGSGRGGKEGPG